MCAVQFCIFSAACFMTFLDPEIWGLYIWSLSSCTRTEVPSTPCPIPTLPQDMEVRPTDEGLMLYIVPATVTENPPSNLV